MTLSPEQFTEELEALKGKLSCTLTGLAANHWEVNAKDWKQIFGDMTPKQLYAHFAKLGNPTLTLELKVEKPGKGRLFILPDGPGQRVSTRNELVLLLTQNITPPVAHVAHAHFASPLQGKRAVHNYLRSGFELCDMLGVKRCTVNATNVGSYAWAKFGFAPATQSEWDSLKEQFDTRLHSFKHTISSGGKTYPMEEGEERIIKKVMDTTAAELPGKFAQLAELDRELYRKEGHSITVGKALLMNTRWHGDMMMQDGHPGYERFKAYTDPERMRGVVT
jgi:hypothetical protein